ncbi:hypothetical protein TcWFU_007656 [Taenia crassiceps]|uniref:Uncharacterized protein n=1 Tax=Taenia crassiceps TaxID=6207 RepID=A0ABR4QMK1_9CEST
MSERNSTGSMRSSSKANKHPSGCKSKFYKSISNITTRSGNKVIKNPPTCNIRPSSVALRPKEGIQKYKGQKDTFQMD